LDARAEISPDFIQGRIKRLGWQFNETHGCPVSRTDMRQRRRFRVRTYHFNGAASSATAIAVAAADMDPIRRNLRK